MPAVDAATAAEATSGVVPAGSAALALSRVIVEAGPTAVGKFVEFFAGRVANERTRAAYARAARQFRGWCEARGALPRGGLAASRRLPSVPAVKFVNGFRSRQMPVETGITSTRIVPRTTVTGH